MVEKTISVQPGPLKWQTNRFWSSAPAAGGIPGGSRPPFFRRKYPKSIMRRAWGGESLLRNPFCCQYACWSYSETCLIATEAEGITPKPIYLPRCRFVCHIEAHACAGGSLRLLELLLRCRDVSFGNGGLTVCRGAAHHPGTSSDVAAMLAPQGLVRIGGWRRR